MRPDEKLRYGLMALAAASLVIAALGLHIGPIAEVAGGAGL
jgi:hypothetical protein